VHRFPRNLRSPPDTKTANRVKNKTKAFCRPARERPNVRTRTTRKLGSMAMKEAEIRETLTRYAAARAVGPA
jgi:hypothetical protein